MNRPGKKLLARPTGTLDENGAAAHGNVRQDVENFLDMVIFADDVLKPILIVDCLSQCFHSGKIPENLHPADGTARDCPFSTEVLTLADMRSP